MSDQLLSDPGPGFFTVFRSEEGKTVMKTHRKPPKAVPDSGGATTEPSRPSGGGSSGEKGGSDGDRVFDEPVIDEWTIHVPGVVAPTQGSDDDWTTRWPGVEDDRVVLARTFGNLEHVAKAAALVPRIVGRLSNLATDKPHVVLTAHHAGIFDPGTVVPLVDYLRGAGVDATVIIDHGSRRRD